MKDEERQARRLARINTKGWEVAQRLSDLKGRQNIELSDMDVADVLGMGSSAPAESPERRLRRFLDQIGQARQRLGSPQYGRCTECGAPLPEAALDEWPWLDRCTTC